MRSLQRTYLILILGFLVFTGTRVGAQTILIPMDALQTDHLKAYGAAFLSIQNGTPVDWLLNYRGGSFLMEASAEMEQELRIRGVSFEVLDVGSADAVLMEVEAEGKNTAVVRLEKTPRIAVYAPAQTLPWDDAVLLALTYAEVPYVMIYDDEVLRGELKNYDWVHLHHEDFTGQYGKFVQYKGMPWYVEQQRDAEEDAATHGFKKVSAMKLAVVQIIREYVSRGGFLFAMCSGTDTFDIALAAAGTDIVPEDFDGDAVDPNALNLLDYEQTLVFQDFKPSFNPSEYEHSDIDTGPPPPQLQNPALDYFTLFEFSARWDPVPSMLTQNHVASVKGFVGQTTAFNKQFIKPNAVILAESSGRNAARYLNTTFGQGNVTFYSGHDPEDYQHFVGDPPTDLALYKNSPGYRLILNNILFPAARKKPQKT